MGSLRISEIYANKLSGRYLSDIHILIDENFNRLFHDIEFLLMKASAISYR